MADVNERLLTYGGSGVLVDSNLLLLLFLGSYERRQIAINKRLATFTDEDFDLLVRFLGQFSKVITTPNILTEVSNLSSAVPESRRTAYFASFAARVGLLEEQHVVSYTALTNRWAKFGLTDAVIAAIAKDQYLVLTDDFRLSQSLQSDGIETVNFNHLRDTCWRMGN
jgi:rRNA-processing protein FCF1